MTWSVVEDPTAVTLRRKVRAGAACTILAFLIGCFVFGANYVRQGDDVFAAPALFLLSVVLGIAGGVLFLQSRVGASRTARREVGAAGARREIAGARSVSVDGDTVRTYGADGVVRTYAPRTRIEGAPAETLTGPARRRRRIVPLLGEQGIVGALWPMLVCPPVALVTLAGLGQMLEAPTAFDAGMLTFMTTLTALLAWRFLRGVSRFAPRELHVGDDGLLFVSLGRKRFLPYRFVTGVRVDGESIVVTSHGGAEERLRLAVQGAAELAVDVATDIEARARRSVAEAVPSPLDKGTRDADRWRVDLGDAVKGGYREQALDPEDLVVALHDPASAIDRRVGAMYALGLADEARAEAELAEAREALADEEASRLLEKARSGQIDEARLTRVLKR